MATAWRRYRAVRPKLQHQFNDLKRDLSHVSAEARDLISKLNLDEPPNREEPSW